VFQVVSNIFSLISNEVLISLHSCLDSTHINCPVATHGVFNFLCGPYYFYHSCIFVDYQILYIDISFHNIIKFFKNIIIHIKSKNPLHHAGLQLVMLSIKRSKTFGLYTTINGDGLMAMACKNTKQTDGNGM
jgi:hypothetical protein